MAYILYGDIFNLGFYRESIIVNKEWHVNSSKWYVYVLGAREKVENIICRI